MADRSAKTPKREVDDMLIKVGVFIFLVDFIILETKPVRNPRGKIPVILGILGRTFLTTSYALINDCSGLMKLTFENMIVDLNIFNLERQPSDPSDEPLDVNLI